MTKKKPPEDRKTLDWSSQLDLMRLCAQAGLTAEETLAKLPDEFRARGRSFGCVAHNQGIRFKHKPLAERKRAERKPWKSEEAKRATREAALTRRREAAAIALQVRGPLPPRKGGEKQKAAARANMRRLHQDPDFAARQGERMRQRWQDPAFRESQAAASSERMRRLHQDPDFHSKTMAAAHEATRRKLAEDPEWRARFAAMGAANGVKHLNHGENEAKKRRASKWIMEQASRALVATAEHTALMSQAIRRFRELEPFVPGDDYSEYCRRQCLYVAADPDYRDFCDTFMREAIPEAAARWQERKRA